MSSKLVPCKTCKKEVAMNAKTCPHCGEKDPTVTMAQKVVGLIVIIVIGYILIGIFSNSDKNISSIKITKATYGDKWAFKQDKAVLKCYIDGDIKSPVIELDGIPYGLTGFADNKYGQKDINAINKYWLYDNKYKGMNIRVDIGTFQKEALKLCE